MDKVVDEWWRKVNEQQKNSVHFWECFVIVFLTYTFIHKQLYETFGNVFQYY